MPRATTVLLNVGHALDHLVLLIFATAVTTIAADFGLARWEDLMPYATGAFLLFGLGSLPAGHAAVSRAGPAVRRPSRRGWRARRA